MNCQGRGQADSASHATMPAQFREDSQHIAHPGAEDRRSNTNAHATRADTHGGVELGGGTAGKKLKEDAFVRRKRREAREVVEREEEKGG